MQQVQLVGDVTFEAGQGPLGFSPPGAAVAAGKLRSPGCRCCDRPRRDRATQGRGGGGVGLAAAVATAHCDRQAVAAVHCCAC